MCLEKPLLPSHIYAHYASHCWLHVQNVHNHGHNQGVLLLFVHMSPFGKKSWKLVDRLVGIATFKSYVYLHVALIYIYTYLYSQKISTFSLWPVAKFGYIFLLVDDQQSTYFTKVGKQKRTPWAQCVWSSQIALMADSDNRNATDVVLYYWVACISEDPWLI